MIRLIRVVGIACLGLGAFVFLFWSITPLRHLWPWVRGLPVPVQIGLGAAAAGLILLMGSLVWERVKERESDRDLLEE